MTRTSASTDEKISHLIDRIEALTFETQEVTRELRQLQRNSTLSPRQSVDPHPPFTNAESEPTTAFAIPQVTLATAQASTILHDFRIGDRVVITNTYLGRKGVSGVVVAITSSQVTLQEQNGRRHKRKHTNLRHE